jgi:dTDP-4-amino-4,6-dideoxygalactose transaminase
MDAVASMTLRERCNFPMLDCQHYHQAINSAVERVIDSGHTILAEGVRGFEASFAAWLGGGLSAEHCLGVANGTDALELAMRCAGVGSGEGVIVPTFTAYATVAAILRIGALPIFVDVEPGRAVLSPAEVELRLAAKASFPRIRAVIAVHLYGEACDLHSLRELCSRHSLVLIEDCAQATGTIYEGTSIGTWGDFAAFSFYPTKNLAALGDGGMLVLGKQSNPSLLATARRMRLYGWNHQREAVQFGANSRLDEVQAWILIGKLADLDDKIKARRSLANQYYQLISPWAGQMGITLPEDGANWSHSYHLYVITVDPEKRPKILARGASDGIPYTVHYPLACHKHPYIAQQLGVLPLHLPQSERLAASVLSLPLNPYLTGEDIKTVSRHLHSLLAGV